MKRRINARPPAFTPGPILMEIQAGDELLFTLHEERDADPIAMTRVRMGNDPDNFLTFNLTQPAPDVEDQYTYYLLMRIIRRGNQT